MEQHSHLFEILKRNIPNSTNFIFINSLLSYAKTLGNIALS